MSHFIITRYGLNQPDPGWYEKRLPFFKRYLKSLQNQTNQNFSVLLLIDKQIPSSSRKECQDLLPDNRFSISTRPLKQPFSESIIQTRIDSDDIIANDFIDSVQKNISPGQMLNFINGYISINDKYYRIRYTSNMFLSVWDKQSCYAHKHTVMYKKYPVTNITSRPMWIHVDHPDSGTWQNSRVSRIPLRIRLLYQKLLGKSPYKNLDLLPSHPDHRFPVLR